MIIDALPEWEARCRSLGMLVTEPRRAILGALLESSHAQDAVCLLQAARNRHGKTSQGTVYRLLRELDQHGLLHVHAPARGRLCWQLRELPRQDSAIATGNVCVMLRQVQGFLRELETLGVAEARASTSAWSDAVAGSIPSHPSSAPLIDVLRDIAGHLGYRLA